MAAHIPTNYHLGPQTITTYWSDETNVIGVGSYLVNPLANLVFIHGVGAGETITLTNVGPKGIYTHPANELVVEDPSAFHAHVIMNYVKPVPGAPRPDIASQPSNIVLEMASHVDSYSYKNDMLKLWLGNKVVETLNLTVHDPFGFTVQKPFAGTVVVSANTADGGHGIVWYGKTHPDALPVHHS